MPSCWCIKQQSFFRLSLLSSTKVSFSSTHILNAQPLFRIWTLTLYSLLGIWLTLSKDYTISSEFYKISDPTPSILLTTFYLHTLIICRSILLLILIILIILRVFLLLSVLSQNILFLKLRCHFHWLSVE